MKTGFVLVKVNIGVLLEVEKRKEQEENDKRKGTPYKFPFTLKCVYPEIRSIQYTALVYSIFSKQE